MKTSTKSITSKFSIPTLTNYISKLTAVTTITTAILGATFSTAKAQDAHPGEAIFKLKCTMCHGQAGEGIAVFPPLAGSEWVNGPAENLVKIQLRGLMGPITVKGKEYNAMMPANATMSDQEIADVLSYVRSNLGNNAPAIDVDTVKAIRAEVAGNATPLTVKDLKPHAAAEAEVGAEVKPEPEVKPEVTPTPEPEVKPTEPEKDVETTPETKTETEPKAPVAAEGSHPGQTIFKAVCAACHGPTGEGVAIFPPLAGSEWVNGPAENLIKIQLHGLTGPIEVKGKLYNGMMPANAAMSDQDIANVLTYVRSSMGNKADAVTPDMVKALRGPDNATPVTAKDLKDPTVKVASLTEPTELSGFKPSKGNGSTSVVLLALGIIGVCTLPVVAGLVKN